MAKEVLALCAKTDGGETTCSSGVVVVIRRSCNDSQSLSCNYDVHSVPPLYCSIASYMCILLGDAGQQSAS